jgi:hypothetical protein
MNKQWAVEFHDEFAAEVRQLPQTVREKLKAAATILSEDGPLLGRPQADSLKGSRHANMKELRFDADGGVWPTPSIQSARPSCWRAETRAEVERYAFIAI